ncbi:MAG: peptide chain release factor H [Saprospiraceae bacterium]|nr:peptide chain release factor H [Saprospiraceae bacterium]MCB9323277.1 peptide chain release factor H [Lewinellaceae bacterium]
MEKIIQISSGKGPEECQWVVAKVLKMFLAEARDKGLTCTVLQREEGVLNNTLKSATVQLEGPETGNYLKLWKGTVQWVGQSEFRKQHKRKNWFIGIYELDLSSEKFDLADKDFKYEPTRSGGPGGQHVNKVSTAIRAIHLPTGLAVLASDSRSQMQNKKMAKERLINMLKARQFQEKKASARSQWQNHFELERGNPVRILKGSDFKSEFVSKSYKSERLKNKKIIATKLFKVNNETDMK